MKQSTYTMGRATSAALNELYDTTWIFPENATNQSVTWTSNNPDIVYIDGDDFKSNMAKGTAVLRVTANDGSDVYAECTVTVE